jgi:hypothetical protein
MRRPLDRVRLRTVLDELARASREPTTVYLVGGTTAVEYGWRTTTIDIDLLLEPERDEVVRAASDIKNRLQVNLEFASPLDFLPPLPGWQDRSPFVAQLGELTVRHFDPYSQALAKLERGFDQDRRDVAAMFERGLIEGSELRRLFDSIEPALYRFPAIDPGSLRAEVDRVTGQA